MVYWSVYSQKEINNILAHQCVCVCVFVLVLALGFRAK